VPDGHRRQRGLRATAAAGSDGIAADRHRKDGEAYDPVRQVWEPLPDMTCVRAETPMMRRRVREVCW
jgi:hypothetical protein